MSIHTTSQGREACCETNTPSETSAIPDSDPSHHLHLSLGETARVASLSPTWSCHAPSMHKGPSREEAGKGAAEDKGERSGRTMSLELDRDAARPDEARLALLTMTSPWS